MSDNDLGMALGMAFGSLVTVIRRSGISDEEIRHWLETALNSYSVANVIISDRPA